MPKEPCATINPLHPDSNKKLLASFLLHTEKENKNPFFGYRKKTLKKGKIFRFKDENGIKRKIRLANTIIIEYICVGNKEYPRYRVLDANPIGKGSYGTVSKIIGSLKIKNGQLKISDWTTMQKPFKVAKLQHHNSFSNKVKSMLREFTFLDRMSHRRQSFVIENTSPCTKKSYMIDAFFDGETMASFIEKLKNNDAKPQPQFFLTIAINLLKELKRIHSFGLIHHDIWPNNILVNKEGKVRVIDFGSTKQQDELFQYGGNHEYRAPEKYRFPFIFSDGQKADIYSAGKVLKEIFIFFPDSPKKKEILNFLEELTHSNPESRLSANTAIDCFEDFTIEPADRVTKKTYQHARDISDNLLRFFKKEPDSHFSNVKILLRNCKDLESSINKELTEALEKDNCDIDLLIDQLNIKVFLQLKETKEFKSKQSDEKKQLLMLLTKKITEDFSFNIQKLCNIHDQITCMMKVLTPLPSLPQKKAILKELKQALTDVHYLMRKVDKRRLTVDNMNELNQSLNNEEKNSFPRFIEKLADIHNSIKALRLRPDYQDTVKKCELLWRLEAYEVSYSPIEKFKNKIRLEIRHYLLFNHTEKSNKNRLMEIEKILDVLDNKSLNEEEIRSKIEQIKGEISTGFFHHSQLKSRISKVLSATTPAARKI